LLGSGTVGTVYRATIKSTGEIVAVKILQEAISKDDLVRARFRREMQILSQLQHPNIIHYFGGGEFDGSLFFAMELLEFGNLRDLLERFGRFSWQETASIGRQVSSALQCAHNNGIIHRDLKPSNLFLDVDANVKLGDFGIARDTKAADITSQGLTVGTHAYMAPEQIRGETIVNGKVDLYSLGCVLFELITGRTPFEGINFAVLFEQHLNKQPPKVSDFVPDCPAALENEINLLLQKDPAKRPFNARSVQGVMNELLASHGANAAGTSWDASPSQTADVPAAAVRDPTLIDAGRTSLARKLRPDNRPESSWKMLAIMGGVIALVVLLAILFGNN
jgi:serine/threonine protein kinase